MNPLRRRWFRLLLHIALGFAAAAALAVAVSEVIARSPLGITATIALGFVAATALAVMISETIVWSPLGITTSEDISESGSPFRFVPKYKVERLAAQYFDGQRLYGTEHKFVYTSEDFGKTWQKLGHLGPTGPGIVNAVRAIVGRSETLRRIVRPKGIWGLLVLRSGTILAYCNPFIYRATDSGRTFELVHKLRMDPEPKVMLHASWCEDAQGNVYYGEYGLTRKGDTHLMKSTDDGKTWQPVFTFPENSIRHIQAVQYDEYREHLWVATGDRNHECLIAYSEDGGRSFTVIGQGEQKWRTVSLLFTSEYVFWGKDSPETRNYIMRWNRVTRTVEEVGHTEGPVYYSARLQDGTMLMATTMEKPGVCGSDHAVVWYSRDGTTWKPVAGFDRGERGFSNSLGGTVLFPLGKPLPKAVFSPLSVKRIDSATYAGDIGPLPMPTSTALGKP